MKLKERLARIDHRLDSHEAFMRDFAQAVQLGFLRLEEKIDGRFDSVDARFDRMDAKFDELQQKMHELNRRQ